MLRYSVSLRIQSECRNILKKKEKSRTRITPNTGTFNAVHFSFLDYHIELSHCHADATETAHRGEFRTLLNIYYDFFGEKNSS